MPTITGIWETTAAVFMSEVDYVTRFKRSNQLLVFAGLNASIYQSGDFLPEPWINCLSVAYRIWSVQLAGCFQCITQKSGVAAILSDIA